MYLKRSEILLLTTSICVFGLIFSCKNSGIKIDSISCSMIWINGGAKEIPQCEYGNGQCMTCADTSIVQYKDSNGVCMVSIGVSFPNAGPYDSLLGKQIKSKIISESDLQNEYSFYKTKNIRYTNDGASTMKSSVSATANNEFCN